jgi:hypothetical protein
MGAQVQNKLIRKLFFRPQTFYLLNHVTLQSKDKEIQRSVEIGR